MTAKIWLYPHAYGTVEEIDLGEDLSDLQYNPRHDQAVSEGMTGEQATTRFSSRAMVRVVQERFTSAAVARKLYLVEDHLKAGGVIAVAATASSAWAGYCTRIPARGESSIEVVNQSIWPYQTTPTMLDGDEIELVANQPRALREYLSISGVTSGKTVTLAESIRYSYLDEGALWVLARHRDFWPALRLPADRRGDDLLTHDHRISYTFDAQLEEAIDVLEAFAGVPSITSSTTTVGGSRGPSMGTVSQGGFGSFGGGSGVPGFGGIPEIGIGEDGGIY